MALDGTGQIHDEQSTLLNHSYWWAGRHSLYVAYSPLAITVIDGQGRCLEVNPAACQMSGYDESELVGKSLLDRLSDETRDAALQQLAALREHGRSSGDIAWIRKDGSTRWTFTQAIKLADDCFVAYCLDISKRRETEEALRHSQAGQSLAEGLVVAERDLAVRLVSAHEMDDILRVCMEAALDTSGLEAGGIYLLEPASGRLRLALHVGLSLEFVAAVSTYEAGSLQDQTVRGSKTTVFTRDQFEPAGFLAAIAEGLTIVAAVPVLHEGHPIACLNVTSRSKESLSDYARLALEAVAAQMGAAIVRARMEEQRLRAAEEKLELERRLLHAQKLESLGVLAGGLAHDFNNILAGIMGYADLLEMRMDDADPARADVEVIRGSVRRAADLTRQMLAYAGMGNFVVELVDLSRVVHESRKMLAVSVSKKAEVTYKLEENLPAIQADVSQIQQVILNLVINASESLGDSSGSIRIATRAAPSLPEGCNALEGKETPQGPFVCLEVADSGCGMDGATLAKIFEPFFSTKFTGRGLGLAALHGIVRSHKGALRVTSEPGKGTTFEVYFSAGTDTTPSSPAEPAATDWRGSGKVLVVDDEEVVREAAQRMVEHAGFSTIIAKDGDEAVGIYRRRWPEITCVLVDLSMPKRDGVETLDELRRICPDVRVILSSGYSEEWTSGHFADVKVSEFVQKPYRFDTLVASLRKAVSATSGQQRSAAATVGRRTVLVVDDHEMTRRSTQVLLEQAGFPTLAAADGEEAIHLYRQHAQEIVGILLDASLPKLSGEETLRAIHAADPHVHAIVYSGHTPDTLKRRFAGIDVLAFVSKPDPLDEAIAKLEVVSKGEVKN
jgi:PAS domain S-box-containing protein